MNIDKKIDKEVNYIVDNIGPIVEQRNKYRYAYEILSDKCSDIIAYYNEFLDELVDELEKYKINNSLEYSLFLNRLIRNGYLSIDNEFKYEESHNEIIPALGLNIILGHGCCRNLSAIHQDVFDKLNIEIKPCYCYYGNVLLCKNKKANHVINFIEYKDNIYGVDLGGNSKVFKLKYPLLESIEKKNKVFLRHKPYYDIITNQDIEDIVELIEDIMNSIYEYCLCSDEPTISIAELEEIKYKIDYLFSVKERKLKRFSNRTKVLKKEIETKMNNRTL